MNGIYITQKKKWHPDECWGIFNGSALKNDSKYQVQELLGYMTVKCAQQIQQFYCGSFMIHFMFAMNTFTLEQKVSYQVHLQSCEKWLLALLCLSVCPSAHTEQPSYWWMDFCEILYLEFYYNVS